MGLGEGSETSWEPGKSSDVRLDFLGYHEVIFWKNTYINVWIKAPVDRYT